MKLLVLYVVMAYAVLPNLYYRKISKKVIKNVSSKEKVIALTFDDGPDPRYTLELLKILRQNNVKCTFFVLAENAEKYPDIIKRIRDEGHYIGLHSLKHKNAIFRLPNKTQEDFFKSINIMNRLGININFFRPPWGIFNPVTFHYAKVNNLKVVLWSIHAMDWSRWVTIDFIKNKLIKNVKSGDIILLHDGRGAKNSPFKTINALKIVLPWLKRDGYRFVMIDEILNKDVKECRHIY
ncbi:polysaccharide deacetylase family protein [Clostridium sp. 19966]|uniref:polysaccharide deacetylase family protein n=1 Tax=Clostridium sp. 19966 TaxID=2768166 RepID=UPI0028DFFBA4|nr:polysaccharide deacetylase family protein [Clostridium sp. 19966]MDT8718479.1 polysaccharide deacetylase family protein [Clostridium sp. 19966]